jgi:hypothetical protein
VRTDTFAFEFGYKGVLVFNISPVLIINLCQNTLNPCRQNRTNRTDSSNPPAATRKRVIRDSPSPCFPSNIQKKKTSPTTHQRRLLSSGYQFFLHPSSGPSPPPVLDVKRIENRRGGVFGIYKKDIGPIHVPVVLVIRTLDPFSVKSAGTEYIPAFFWARCRCVQLSNSHLNSDKGGRNEGPGFDFWVANLDSVYTIKGGGRGYRNQERGVRRV